MRKFALPLPLLLVLCLSVRPAAPPSRPPAAALEKWTVDDVVFAEGAGDFQVSPDGRWAAWVKTWADKEKAETVSHIFRTDLKSGKRVQLTRGAESCTSPRWSPDGEHLAFLSSRPAPRKGDEKGKGDEEKSQIWLLDSSGGEPWPLTDGGRGVVRFAWAGPEALVFAAQEEPTRRETVLKEDKKDTSVVVEDDRHEPPVRLFKVEVKSKKVTRLTDNRDRIENLAVSPDGKHAVAIHARSLRFTWDNKVKPVVYLYDLEKGGRRRLFAEPAYNVGSVRWALDGKGLYAVNEHSSQPQFAQLGVSELHYYDLGTDKSSKVDLDWPRGLTTQTENDGVPGLVVLHDGFLALLANGVRHMAARYQG